MSKSATNSAAQGTLLAPEVEVAKDKLTLPTEKTKYEIEAEQISAKVAVLGDITNDIEYVTYGELGTQVATLLKNFTDFMDPIKEALYRPYKDSLTRIKAVEDPLTQAKRVLSAKIGAYDRKKEEERQAEERRLREEAARQQEQTALDEGAALESEGRHEEAAAVVQQAIEAPISVGVSVARTTPIVSGVSKARVKYKAEVFDLMALVKAVAEGKVSIQAICANESYLNKIVDAEKGKSSIPGVRSVDASGVSFRAAK